MSPAEQEELFAKLRAAHPKWTTRFVSGYVHGAMDEGLRFRPKGDHLYAAKARDEYGLGYLVGFAMRRGEDAEIEPWFVTVGELVQEARRAATTD